MPPSPGIQMTRTGPLPPSAKCPALRGGPEVLFLVQETVYCSFPAAILSKPYASRFPGWGTSDIEITGGSSDWERVSRSVRPILPKNR